MTPIEFRAAVRKAINDALDDWWALASAEDKLTLAAIASCKEANDQFVLDSAAAAADWIGQTISDQADNRFEKERNR